MTTMTAAEVARELLRRDDPESDAARQAVYRLVRLGMPALKSVRPWLFDRDQVREWFRRRAEAESRPTPAPASSSTSRPRRARRRRSGAPATLGELRASMRGDSR